jgi:predicted RNA binding protein YcfA (HicA-like mRNA interferase family)
MQEQSLDSLSRPEVSSSSFAEVKKRERDAFAETNQRLDMIINREGSTIRSAEQAKRDSGWFGGLSRALTLSDPYKIEISNARQKIGTAQHARTFVEQAKKEKDPLRKVELLNQARRLAGLREVKPGSFNVSEQRPQSSGLNRVDIDNSHFELEQEAITVTRDVAITTVVTVGTLGGGAAGSLATRGSQVAAQSTARVVGQAAFMGGLEAGAESTARNIDDVQRGEVTVGQAVGRVTRDTAVGAAFGGSIGAGVQGVSRGVSRLRQGSEVLEEGADRLARGVDSRGDEVLDSVLDEGLTDVVEESVEQQARAANPLESVDEDDIMDRILNSPSIEAERNARMIVAEESEELLVGVGAAADSLEASADVVADMPPMRSASSEIGGRAPDVSAVDSNAGNLRNADGPPSSDAASGRNTSGLGSSADSSTSQSSGPGRTSNTSQSSSPTSETRPQATPAAAAASTPSNSASLSVQQAEDMFMDAAETVQRLARGETLPYAEQVALMKKARLLAENGIEDVLEALQKSPDFKELEMAELADLLINSNNIDKVLTREQQVALNEHLFPADGSNPFPEITGQITKRQQAKLQRTASGPKVEDPLVRQLAGKDVREVIRVIEADGWVKVGQAGSHRQYKHPTKPGKVTINGKESDVFGDSLLRSILKQAGLD